MSNYQMTPLEDYVKELYQRAGIMESYQLDMLDIAEKLNVWIHFMDMESQAIDRNGLNSIVINRRLSPAEQWQEFGHELCHVLRHAGNQLSSPIGFIKYQETQAEHFAQHFCIPSFKLSELGLPKTQSEAIALICDKFNVTPSFASERLEIHLRKLHTAQNDEIVQLHLNTKKKIKPQLKPREWSSETLDVLKQLEQLKRKEVNQYG